ncbi:unnamed protein product [Hyaloperonospora brassicae]|uniref:Uncharacterized protein n=1 Tax=Hyaloperonospora brassicae TaxID=162125 RepID=A0AAV0TCH8_HYABA|nr:unnamed protein product [Hyaloperonospora brassicae]
MAKRKFVSSKKNAPSRTISSKEAALRGRSGGADGAASESSDSAASSNVESSTPVSSESEQEDDDGNLTAGQQPVAVDVMPASVGRGKQLRFPSAISRGKVLPTEGGVDSDAEDSDDESLLSVAESDDEEHDRGATTTEVEEEPAIVMSVDHEKLTQASHESKANNETTSTYPIKAVRARKRHRPDSDYYKQMSTYVRDCLLRVRCTSNSETSIDAIEIESSSRHDEFRRQLAVGEAERVTWKEPPSVESGTGDQSDEAKSSKMNQSSKSSSLSKTSKPVKSNSKDKELVMDSKKTNTNKSASLPSNENAADNLTLPARSPAPVAPTICEVCKKKMNGETGKEEEQERLGKSVKTVKTEDVKEPLGEVKKENTAPQASTPPVGSFMITFLPEGDAQKLRLESAKLMDEARKLKHEGNRRGSSECGTEGQLTQGKYYLRSGAKFFAYALKLQEVKVAYQKKSDAQHAQSFGENCITTLSQTSSLVESTIRAFQSAGSMRLAALGCKMAAVIHLTVYRLQHRKLQSFYSELFTPGRSPESRENGLTPPIDPNNNLNSCSSKDAAMRKHLLKEMEHTLRGFEMWRRYESYKVSVLPRVTNPVILDPAVFFEDLEAELSQS